MRALARTERDQPRCWALLNVARCVPPAQMLPQMLPRIQQMDVAENGAPSATSQPLEDAHPMGPLGAR